MDDFHPLLARVEESSETHLGHMKGTQVQLVINDFYMSPGKIKIVTEFELAG